MGLFFGKKKKKKEADAPRFSGTLVEPWAVPPTKGTYRVEPRKSRTVYTYNGSPFVGIEPFERFVIAAVPANVAMTSAYNGRTSTTAEFEGLAYEYNGQVFGFCSSFADDVERLLRAGYRVELEAMITGFDEKLGFPYIQAFFGPFDGAPQE